MGDFAPELPADSTSKEVRILVTGYGAFHARYPVNSSWSIASTLPDHLPATTTCPRIKIIVPPEPIQVAYSAVAAWEEANLNLHDYDLVLHIGLAAGRKFFTVERRSTRIPYWQKEDVLGQVFSKEMTEKMWPSETYPDVLAPTFDCHDVWLRWRENVRQELDVRPSDDPGNYLCGFIYYYSMAWYLRNRAEECPVMFLHVPDLPTEAQVAGGREVALGLIRAMVESREKKGIVRPRKPHVSVANEVVEQLMDITQQPPKPAAVPKTAQDDDMSWTYQR